MQIGNALGQYQANMDRTAGAQKAPAAASTASANAQGPLAGLGAGSVFEGTVSGMNGGRVQISLSDGSSISARLGADVPIQEGQSLFFEVKSNEGGLIEIRPFENGAGFKNPTILSALDAAGLSATADHVRMVDTMMQESLSIDKGSLTAMARLIGNNPEIAPETLIQMQKLGLPISPEMAAQFENYKTDSHQILNKMNEILTAVTDTLGSETTSGSEALALNDKLLSILTEGGEANAAEAEIASAGVNPEEEGAPAAAQGEEAAQLEGKGAPAEGAKTPELGKEIQVPPEARGEAAPETLAAKTSETGDIAAGNQALSPEAGEEGAVAKPILAEGDPAKEYAGGTLGDILSKSDAAELEKNLAALDKNGTLRERGFSLDMSAEEFARKLTETLKEMENPDDKALKNLLSGKSYLNVLKEMTREQWTVKPENLSGDRIKDLYENLDRQMRQTENVLREMGMKDTELAKSVSDLKNNLEFMDQVNQNYTYLQIPLRFQNQNAHSDLYVYTNKKNLNDPNAELSAFLHLDMEHLGSTDVAVRMKNKAVNTKFYMEDDASFDLILSHADELSARLEKKGYQCRIEAVNDAKNVDFVEDFLKAGGGVAPTNSSHLIHRYSFDIKA